MTSLPLWLQITGLIAASLWPVYQLWCTVIGPKLDVRLTKDLFFRFTELGECLFIRPVLIAEHGNVLIKNIKANLKRTGPGASKNWELEFLHFGEMVSDNKSVQSNFCFHSSSPFKFLCKGVPLQAVYLTRAIGYGDKYEELFQQLEEELIPIREESPGIESNTEKQTTLKNKIYDLSKKYANNYSDKLQLEEGKYELALEITYSSNTGISAYFKRRSKSSKITFEIEKNAREQIKSKLPAAIYNMALNKIFNTNLIVGCPEYLPINKKEDVAL